MVESCSQAKSILGPYLNKEFNCNNKRLSFEDRSKQKPTNYCETRITDSALNYSTSKSCKPNLESVTSQRLYQLYADKLLIAILESLKDKKMCHCIFEQEKINTFSSKVVAEILEASYQDFIPAMKLNNKYLSIEKLANSLVIEALCPVVATFQNGLLEYSQLLSNEILSSALKTAAHRLYIERVSNQYAEKLSLRVFRDFFIHIITDANRIGYHLLGSYEAVSKNQLRTFAENIIEHIMKELFPHKKRYNISEPSLLELFADSLSHDIVLSAISFTNRTHDQPSNSSVSLKVAEKYASKILQSFFIDVPVLTVNNQLASARSSVSSTNAIYRRDSDEQSEAITPRSAAGESHWKRGIFHFADQLLYSLTALEKDNESDAVSELGDTIVYRRTRRCGSCPHIHEKPFSVSKDLAARRKSETIVCVRRNLQSFAEDLACDILYSIVPSAVKRVI